MRIALATYSEFPELDHDDSLLIPALAEFGHEAEPAVWDADVDWSRYGAVVIRETWDYFRNIDAFKSWIRELAGRGIRVLNPPDLIFWNSDKRYLLDLGERGIDIVPTELLARGNPAAVADVFAKRGWGKAVIKPAVSANAYQTWLVSAGQVHEKLPRLRDLFEHSHVLMQQYMPQVAEEGERSFIFFDGTFSHAVLKRPNAGDYRVQEQYGGTAESVAAEESLVEQARRVIGSLPITPVYARVDGVNVEGSLRLMELEVIEPTLYMRTCPGSERTFASAIDNVVLGR